MGAQKRKQEQSSLQCKKSSKKEKVRGVWPNNVRSFLSCTMEFLFLINTVKQLT